ncbi:MAG: RNA methyltransferase [Clostridia bacterium]|nr:RNA methyltransferase [Clostridia bacterium]
MPIKEAEKFADSSVMEGMTSVRAVFAGNESGVNDRKIEKILFDKAKARKKAKELGFLRAKSYEQGFEIELTSAEEIDALAIGASHGGVLAYTGDRTIKNIKEANIKENGFYVYLQGIEDPYNFGYALRSLYAAGVDGIVLEKRNWLSAAGVVCRASAGASEMFDLSWGEPEEIAEVFHAHGYTIVAADKTENAVSVYDTQVRFPVLLVIGGEKRGISAEFSALCDKTVMLDYGRDFRAALSAASASSIIAFEIFRQNRGKTE